MRMMMACVWYLVSVVTDVGLCVFEPGDGAVTETSDHRH